MPDKPKDDQEQTEQTPKGFRVRVPSRAEFFGNLRKTAEPDKPEPSSSGSPREPAES
jgi:hypothetical protein